MYKLVVAVLVILGATLLLISPNWSIGAADMWLRSVGGVSDGTSYQAMITGYRQAFQILGGVMLGTGLYGVLRGLLEERKVEG